MLSLQYCVLSLVSLVLLKKKNTFTLLLLLLLLISRYFSGMLEFNLFGIPYVSTLQFIYIGPFYEQVTVYSASRSKAVFVKLYNSLFFIIR